MIPRTRPELNPPRRRRTPPLIRFLASPFMEYLNAFLWFGLGIYALWKWGAVPFLVMFSSGFAWRYYLRPWWCGENTRPRKMGR